MTKKTRQKPKVPTRKQTSRLKKAQRQERMVLIGAAIVAFLLVAVPAFGYWREYIAKPAQPVAVVNGASISTANYQKMVRFRRYGLYTYMDNLEAELRQLDPNDESTSFLLSFYQQSLNQAQRQLQELPTLVLEDLIDEALIKQEATKRGLSISPEEVDVTIEEQFGYYRVPPTPTPTPITPTLPLTITPAPTVPPVTQAQFQERYRNYLARLKAGAGMSEADYRQVVEVSLLRDKLQEIFASQVPTSEEQIKARHILLESREEAEAVLERLRNGEDFEALAKELSQDEGSKDEGGDLGWFPRGQMVPEFEQVAFALEPGQISDIITSTFGFHIIKVEDRQADRPLDSQILSLKQDQALDQWLEQQRESADVQRFWSESIVPVDERSTSR